MQENKIVNGEILVKKVELENLNTEPKRIERPESGHRGQDISFLSEVYLPIRVELGHSRMKIKEMLELGPGSVVQLDKLPEEPVELFIGEKFFAYGEMVMAGDRLGIRIIDLFTSEEENP